MKRIRTAAAFAIILILFALGAFAVQNPTPPSGQASPQQTVPPSQQVPPSQTAPPSQQAPPPQQHATAPPPVIGDSTLSRDDKIQKIRSIREATITKVRGFLNDDQKKKLDQMLAEPGEPPHSEPPRPKEPPQSKN